MKIGIIGTGWYGIHIALELKKAGHEVFLLEKNSDIMHGISGEYGIRLHKGPHYQLSQATRESCLESFKKFELSYPELLTAHEYSIYALGTTDADGNAPKVNVETFSKVCHESEECVEIDPSRDYTNLQSAMTLDEPSIALGERLRSYFREKLSEARIPVYFNYEVDAITSKDNKSTIHSNNYDNSNMEVDYVVNATSYQSLIPENFKTSFPIPMEAVYQPCLALRYKDKEPGDKPISFIVMDGWFPCLMPVITNNTKVDEYIMTHGSYTIMSSCTNVTDANKILNEITDSFINNVIKIKAEAEMDRFWPAFKDRFEFIGWKGTVLAKLKTKTEFRSSVTFEHKNTIYVFPGKVSNIFNAAEEVLALVSDIDCEIEGDFRYTHNGVLSQAKDEISNKPEPGAPNTCNLETFKMFKSKTSKLSKCLSDSHITRSFLRY